MISQEAIKKEVVGTFKEMQRAICAALESLDTKEKFIEDLWDRTDLTGSHGGGGVTRVITNGAIFEKGGVNFSEVHGTLPKEMAASLYGVSEEVPFYATGTSLVIHPLSPLIPTIHANVRYLQVKDKNWFGGGVDLTPYYVVEDDCVEFHRKLKMLCEKHDPSYYVKFKEQCDSYFYLPHRNEARGIGGLFFDYLGREPQDDFDKYKRFVFDFSTIFNELYIPIVEKHKDEVWSDTQKKFQLLRRGRYVEFNLIYDKGTLFGLKTNGRTESILMSLPPHANWEYGFEPDRGSAEEKLILILQHPRNWV